MRKLKILFIRGLGNDTKPEHAEMTRTALAARKATMEYILKPHNVEVADLDGSGFKERWMPVLDKQPLEDYDVLIGHSTGVHALLRCAEKRKLKNLLLVGATSEHNDERSELITGWFDTPWNYDAIIKNTRKIIICNGKKDPYIKPEEAKNLAQNLKCTVYLFRKQGHLSEWWLSHVRDESAIIHPNNIVLRLIEELVNNTKSNESL